MSYSFQALVELFPTDKGWYYAAVPTQITADLGHLSDHGLIAVTISLGSSSWPTSLIPKGDGTYFIPLPAKIRKKEKLELASLVGISFGVRERKAK